MVLNLQFIVEIGSVLNAYLYDEFDFSQAKTIFIGVHRIIYNEPYKLQFIADRILLI